MSVGTLFSVVNLLPLPFWLLMVFIPGWSWTRRVMRSLWPVAGLCLIYAVLLFGQLSRMGAGLLDLSLAGIAAGFSNPAVALIGWVHYLAFDLFVGRWVYLHSRRRNHPTWIVSVCLALIFLAGPLGLVLYLGLYKLGVLSKQR